MISENWATLEYIIQVTLQQVYSDYSGYNMLVGHGATLSTVFSPQNLAVWRNQWARNAYNEFGKQWTGNRIYQS